MEQREWTLAERLRLCREAGSMLTVLGYAANSATQADASPHRAAAALLLQTAGDLVRASGLLIKKGHLYAVAALSRQLLEITYLLQYFLIAPDRASFWLSASDKELRLAQDLKIGELRKAVGDADPHYSHHCALGGHPRRLAALLLPGSPFGKRGHGLEVQTRAGEIKLSLRDMLTIDLLQHLRPLLIVAIESLEPSDFELYQEQTDRLVKDFTSWFKQDPCSTVAPG